MIVRLRSAIFGAIVCFITLSAVQAQQAPLPPPSIDRAWSMLASAAAPDKSKNPQLITRLRAALDDPDPQVAYAAATTLWKMHDSSGEDLLLAVAAGDAHDKLGMIKAEKHKAAKELHSPGALVKIGIMQGSGFFLGPFGFGVKAIDYIHKNGGDPGRAAAIDMLAEEHTETVHEALIDA